MTAVSCVLRARGAGHRQRADAGGEAAMGFGMAVMAVPLLWSATPTVSALLAWGFTAVFGALLAHGAWLATSGGRGDRARHGKKPRRREGAADRGGAWFPHDGPRRHVHHLVGGAAMLYMSLAMALGTAGASGTAHAAAHSTHSAPGGVPVVTGLLLGYFAVYALWTAARLMPVAADRMAAGVAGASTGAAVGATAAPLMRQAGIAAGCRLAMATGMFAMLITL
ncbi:DUF5134 domain-containing protein [Streptomyces tubbatahanensis]|uniref:DUF5134 domain-containing protein n=1 Tax=Streptomyces tubbatahanensis TaxID=2923272 RepID=UPI00311B0286